MIRDRETVAEIVCFSLLLGYLIWVPLPFGSASDAALTPLVVPPLLLGAVSSVVLRRDNAIRATRHARLWIAGGLLTLGFMALQLVPLPLPLLRLVSPESARMWSAADRVAILASVPARSFHPITIDPSDTAVQFFRVTAYVATFLAALVLVRNTRRRLALVIVLTAMATFEAAYAFQEAALGRYEIWGWKNTLIFNRATGTFVNPNHFAHYAALALPPAVFIGALAWHTAAAPGVPLGRRIVLLVERRFVLLGLSVLTALASVAAMLISQSRGAILSTAGGFAIVGAVASGRRHAALRAALIVCVVGAVFGAMFLFLGGRAGAAKHLEESDLSTLLGRSAAMRAALRTWTHFPLFGSGAGTFEDISPRAQEPDETLIANHVHNDYLEALATTGAVGFLLGFVPLIAGTVSLARAAFGTRAMAQSSWRQRAFCAAALTSIVIALLHALVDFNFYIPANPVTLAAIAGAATGVREHASR